MQFAFTGMFAGDTFFGWILFGGQPGGAIEVIVIALLVGTVYFWLQERYADNMALWWINLSGGAQGWFLKRFAMTVQLPVAGCCRFYWRAC